MLTLVKVVVIYAVAGCEKGHFGQKIQDSEKVREAAQDSLLAGERKVESTLKLEGLLLEICERSWDGIRWMGHGGYCVRKADEVKTKWLVGK